VSENRKNQVREIQIKADDVSLDANLYVPEGAPGIVVIIGGDGGIRNNPRDLHIARELQTAGLGTLLLDVLTEEEVSADIHTRHLRFDISLLAQRAIAVVDWISEQSFARSLRLGFFVGGAGAAAAIIATAERPDVVGAIVAHSGRPDLAANALPRVQKPTLLIVGGLDYPLIELNEQALANMDARPIKEMQIIPGATHLFEEQGTLEQVAKLAEEWFLKFLPPSWQE
jgi:dienelactone hydrolase